ncbi:MAG: SCO family protein [Candidatus Binatia bacterium]
MFSQPPATDGALTVWLAGNKYMLETVVSNEGKQRMRIINATLLGACLASLPVVNSFANVYRPFTTLSTSIDASAKHRALPDFPLVERSGNKITLAGLCGKIWIADFIYTHCTDTCPLQGAGMAKLQDRWMKEGKLKLVSFSVDPERDTPRLLSEYAKRSKADANRWLFLTGRNIII